MLKVAVTGNIGSGKTTVQNVLKKQGYLTLCADKISHCLLKYNEKIKKIVFEKFKTLDRKELANIIFSDMKSKKELETIMYDAIRTEIIAFLKKNEDKKVIFVFVPLLFEAGFENIFDKIIFVNADKKTRYERILNRKNYDAIHAVKRIQAQEDVRNKIQKSDIIIENNGTIDELNLQIEKILKDLHILPN